MKAIMMSIRPEWVAKILNGEKTIEIRKKFPSDYVGWVYIYCTKGKDELWFLNQGATNQVCKLSKDITAKDNELYEKEWTCNNKLNGKVVARFWRDKVEEISYNYRGDFTSVYTDTLDTEDLEQQACLTRHEFAKYLEGDYGYAIHITKLEIFDEPKEISEFSHYDNSQYQALPNGEQYKGVLEPLTRAPQSYCYIEV